MYKPNAWASNLNLFKFGTGMETTCLSQPTEIVTIRCKSSDTQMNYWFGGWEWGLLKFKCHKSGIRSKMLLVQKRHHNNEIVDKYFDCKSEVIIQKEITLKWEILVLGSIHTALLRLWKGTFFGMFDVSQCECYIGFFKNSFFVFSIAMA